MTVNVIKRLTACLLALFLATGDSAAAQGVESTLKEAMDQLETARLAKLDLIAPEHFQHAAEELSKAQQKYERGERIEDIQALVQEARQQLTKAQQFEEVGRVLLREALAARSNALEANAPEFASEEWEEGEEALHEAGREVEKGDQNDARKAAAEATRQYQAAELKAIRADVLDQARQLREQALDEDAERWASVTFKEAETRFRQAEEILQQDRAQRSEARQQAESAATQYRHATRIASVAKRVRENPESQIEVLIRDHEGHMARIADSLNFQPSFDAGAEPVAEEIMAAINSLYEDRSNLQQELTDREAEVMQLRGSVDSLDAKLAQLEQREQAVTAELRERERREQTFREAQAIFSPDEAEISLSGDEMIVRLYSLSFPVGSSEIRPENFSLLTKLQQVLRQFPRASVVVAGHTDAQGNDDTNQALSQKRAEAIQEYLLANMAMEPGRLQAVGYGEARPIASNETEDGRAKNRRIDVVLNLSAQ